MSAQFVDVSFAVIAAPHDVEYLPTMLRTLPDGCEVVILWNEQGDDHEVRIKESKLDTSKLPYDFREYTVQWSQFSFSTMRNLCGQLCTRSWIFWIDCDDALLTWQHEYFTDTLTRQPPGVGAVSVGIVGVQPNHELSRAGDIPMRFHDEQVRIYRRLYGFSWEGDAHEQIGWSVQRAGYTIAPSSLMVIHRGYASLSPEAMRRKMQRNVSLLSQTLQREWGPQERAHFTTVLARDANTLTFYNNLLGVT